MKPRLSFRWENLPEALEQNLLSMLPAIQANAPWDHARGAKGFKQGLANVFRGQVLLPPVNQEPVGHHNKNFQLIPRMHTSISNLLLSQDNFTLTLSDGNSWTIVGKDKNGAEMSCLLAETMQLQTAGKATEKLVLLDKHSSAKDFSQPIFSDENLKSIRDYDMLTCRLNPADDRTNQVNQLLELSQIFCSMTENKGGLAIHGALAEINGNGVILAGRGNVGKTTASRRLPPPWLALSDDSSLIVLDKNNCYQAHPWPTWSALIDREEIETWNVQYSLPLKAVFILSQSPADRVEQLGKGQAACLLNETVDQASWGLDARLEDKERQAIRLQRFDNICRLVQTIPTYLLHISRNGSFWKEMEKVL
jgi:SynChlorMet cassette protein ScmC